MREVRCTACDTLNRIRDYSVTHVPKCGKCGAALAEPARTRSIRVLHRSRVWTASILASGALLTYVWFVSHHRIFTQADSSANSVAVTACVVQNAPRQGVYESSDVRPRVAPFKIRAAGLDYFVKLESTQDFFISTSFFIYGGAPFETGVPLGTYVLKYAAGKTWCGRKDLFGKDTFAKKGTTLLVFDEEPDGYGGQEITLIAEVGGNFHTEYIDLSQF